MKNISVTCTFCQLKTILLTISRNTRTTAQTSLYWAATTKINTFFLSPEWKDCLTQISRIIYNKIKLYDTFCKILLKILLPLRLWPKSDFLNIVNNNTWLFNNTFSYLFWVFLCNLFHFWKFWTKRSQRLEPNDSNLICSFSSLRQLLRVDTYVTFFYLYSNINIG